MSRTLWLSLIEIVVESCDLIRDEKARRVHVGADDYAVTIPKEVTIL